jgi:diaminopimelate epimerase
MKLPLIKCHGSKNEFLIIDETQQFQLSNDQRIQFSQVLCDPSNGIGADGILFYISSQVADACMKMLNPDGSEAEMCGNGLRCIGRYCSEQLDKSSVLIETMKANLEVCRVADIIKNVDSFEAEIKPVCLEVKSLPMMADSENFVDKIIPSLSKSLKFTALSIPNPHLITFVDEIDENVVQKIGERANELVEILPRGVNVSFVKLLAPQQIFVMTYERGVGITNACGTAMSASSFVSCYLNHNQFGQTIKVLNKGGMVNCTADLSKLMVKLSGNATFAQDIEINWQDQSFIISRIRNRDDETQAYQQLVDSING